jgi:hypothetical protein
MEEVMSFDAIFSAAGTAAFAGWAILILLPRWPLTETLLRSVLIGALSLTYAVLIFVWFFRVEGGGFGSIAQVRALFLSDPVLVAGWIHYLAFDLFVGLWIAREADAVGLSRVLQAPILGLTFLFGPIGLLVFLVTRQVLRIPPLRPAGAA